MARPAAKHGLIGLLAAMALGDVPQAHAGDLAYITCQNGDALSVVDLDTGEERARWRVPGKPAGVAVAADRVFTVAPDAKQVRRHNPVTGDVLAVALLDGGPIGIAHDAARHRVFVSDWYNARIWVLDHDTLTVIRELTTGAAPAGLAVSPDGRFVASADRDTDQVSIFNANTLALHARVKVGIRPFGLRFAPDGRLFVGNVGSDSVTVIAPEQATVQAQVPVGARPYGVSFAQGRAFVTNQYADSLSVIDLSTLTPVSVIDTGEYPEGIDTSSDGRRIIVANWFENSIDIVDATSMNVINQVDSCDGPRAFGTFIREETK